MDEFDLQLTNCLVKEGYNPEELNAMIASNESVKRVTKGVCPVCGKETIFIAENYWLRDHYRCVWCHSIPRQRALIRILSKVRPKWKNLKIHESSPSGSPLKKFKEECPGYSYSYYDEGGELGKQSVYGGDNCTNQNLECMTFEDEIFDIFITQDVFEHIARPQKAYREIARVLKKGGVHVFTVPLYPFIKSRSRICIEEGTIKPVLPPIYHGNPISDKGALVTYDWGYDIAEEIEKSSGMKTKIHEFMHTEENYKLGIEGDFLWVISSYKHEE